jgi:transcriptional regulator GlxA family with amidase domain
VPGHTVDVVVFDGFQPLDAVGPYEVFAGANAVLDDLDRAAARYDVHLRAVTGGAVSAESGLRLVADPLATRVPDTLLVSGGNGVYDARRDPRLLRWLQRYGRRASRISSVCSGAFVLAEAGLLDGCRATTHWARAGRLGREYPDVMVEPDAIYVRDGNVWTSAGVTAGVDLALAMVEHDHGNTIAQTVARWMVVFLRRPGGQSQFAAGVWHDSAPAEPVQQVVEAVRADPGRHWTLATMAAHVHLSERHLGRLFAETMGVTAARYVERVRVEAARHQLETSRRGVADIARHCGFGTAETMRRTFLRTLSVAPSDYRARFSTRLTA